MMTKGKRSRIQTSAAGSEASSRQIRFRSESPEQELQEVSGGDQAASDDEEDGNANVGGKVLSLHAPNGSTIAAAYFDPDVRKVYVLEDTRDTPSWDLATLVMEQVEPELVIMSTKAQDTLIDIVREFCSDRSTNSILQPFRTYQPASATYELGSVRLPHNTAPVAPVRTSDDTAPSSEYDELAERYGYAVEEKGAGMGKIRLNLLKLGCYVNVDAPLARDKVSAAGGLLTYLAKERVEGAVPEEGGPLELAAIESMALDEHMLINNDALTSLAIFNPEAHGCFNADRQKEGLSIFGLLGSTISTPLGRKLLHTWHLRPLLDIQRIEERHQAVELFSNPHNQDDAAQMRRLMKGVGNVTAACTRLLRGRGKPRDWKRLVDALITANVVRDTAVRLAEGQHFRVVEELRNAFTQDMYTFAASVAGVIDWDASRDEKRICIRIGIDQEMDQWRETLASFDVTLSQISRSILPTVPPQFVSDMNVVYFPQLGFFVAACLRVEESQDVEAWEPRYRPNDWEAPSFHTDNLHYYKTPEMRNLDDHYGDLHSLIIDREVEIASDLGVQLNGFDQAIGATIEAIAELDCLLAFAHATQVYDLRRPIMTYEPIFEVKDGRHLLHEQCVSPYISNDTVMAAGAGGEHSSMMIVTGANGSGKSAYGKQVALIAFMAQIGCFVPAQYAKIGICDKIFTRLQTRESVSKTASAFMIDLGQVSHALRGATNQSLIILDEFGKGVIEHLLDGLCPRTIVLTHFHELFTQQFLSLGLPILYCHMQTIQDPEAKNITYLYKLSPNLCLTSKAAECALLHGVPAAVVERGREVSRYIATFQITKILDATLTEKDEIDLQKAEELTKRFLLWNIDEENTDVMDILKELLDMDEEEEMQVEAQEQTSSDVELGEVTEVDSGGEEDRMMDRGW